jgi:hypothetical protein
VASPANLRLFDSRELGVPRYLFAAGICRLSRYNSGVFKQSICPFSLAAINLLFFRLKNLAGEDVDIVKFMRREK